MRHLSKDFPITNPVNVVPPDYDGSRCTWEYSSAYRQRLEQPIHCGLPAQVETLQGEPRCWLHARHKPDGFGDYFVALIESGALIAEARLEYHDLRGMDLSGLDLEGIRFEGADLRGANLGRGHVSFANFSGADLSGACLHNAGGIHVEFSGACLRDADLRDSHFDFVQFLGADLRGADLAGAQFREARLSGCKPPPEELVGLRLGRRIIETETHPDDRKPR